jgi:hypothetical protein
VAETEHENRAEGDEDSTPDKTVPAGMTVFRRVILNQAADDGDCAQADEQPLPPGITGNPVLLIREKQNTEENQYETAEKTVKGAAAPGFPGFLPHLPALLAPILISRPFRAGIGTCLGIAAGIVINHFAASVKKYIHNIAVRCLMRFSPNLIL